MKLKEYIKDKLYMILLFLLFYLIILLFLIAFKVTLELIIAISFLLFVLFVILFFTEYIRKRDFYNELSSNTQKLDKAYLVLETLNNPSFYEGKIVFDILYQINKSMNENVKKYEMQMNDFKNYIEMWIHEVKIPISSLVLIEHNNKNKFDRKTVKQLRRLENYVEQVLYYVRSENAEKDYLINKVPLKKVIGDVILNNKDDFLEKEIDLIIKDTDYFVFSDSKWLSFIINQIINNSIKYKKDKGSYIKICVEEDNAKTSLVIEDNGIGIPKNDIKRVFEKSFTGYNGRIKTKSTGMGLFIAKNLCQKLGHEIKIESKEGKYTKVIISFSKNKFYDVVN